jgi:hypothetical protein
MFRSSKNRSKTFLLKHLPFFWAEENRRSCESKGCRLLQSTFCPAPAKPKKDRGMVAAIGWGAWAWPMVSRGCAYLRASTVARNAAERRIFKDASYKK